MKTAETPYASILSTEILGTSNLIAIGGRPTSGKTGFGIDLILASSIHAGKSSLFLSLELSSQEVTNHLVSKQSNVAFDKVATGRLSETEISSVEKAKNDIATSNIAIAQLKEPSLEALQELIVAQKNRPAGLDIVVIDYLQLMSVSKGVSNNRNEAVNELVTGLKQIAREAGIPIVLLSQVSRDIEKRDDKTPLLSDFHTAGKITFIADMIVFIHRPDRYDPTDSPGEVLAIVAKHRFGATGTYSIKAA